jgi:hypothetical protein
VSVFITVSCPINVRSARAVGSIDKELSEDKITLMTTHPEALYYPYTKKSLLAVRCFFAIGGLVLAIVSFWHQALVIGLILLILIWLFYERGFSVHRRRREEILNHGHKTIAKILDKSNDFRRRLCFFLIEYEFQFAPVETTVCVSDAVYHRHQSDDQINVLVSPTHPKQCVVLDESMLL